MKVVQDFRISGFQDFRQAKPQETLAPAEYDGQILKDDPQPQVVLAFGLVTINREPSSPSV